jgi:hypothetical protein
MTGDNSDTTLTLSVAPVHENNVQVYFDGVYQSKSNYSISGTTLTFSTAPPTGVLVEAITNTNTSSTTANILLDADSDTKIQVEESSDEDKIRFDIAGTEEMVMDATGIVINEGSNDRDFRIESDTNANSLFLEGSTSHIGLGTGSPDDNSFGAGHGILAVASATGSAKTAMLNLMGDGNDTDATRVASIFFNDQSATGAGKSLAGVEAYRASNHATDPGGILLFSTNASGGSYTEKMRIDSAGKVSINAAGASSPEPRQHFQVIHHSGGGRRSTLYYNQDNKIALGALNASDTWEDLAIEGANIALKTGGSTNTLALNIDQHGHVRMPLQSSAGVTATAQSNIGSLTTLDFDTERFDQNGDFDTSNNTFTAPTTGKYLVCANVWVNNLDTTHDYYQLYVVTSNQTYYTIFDTSVLTGDPEYWSFPFSGVVDMDESDTVLFKLLPGGSGTAQADLVALSYISVTLLN